MKHLNHSLLVFLLACLVAPSYAQDREEEKSNDTKNSRTQGLKRITPARHWDMDDDALEVHIEKAVENAMRSVEVALEKMEINLRPMEFNMRHLDIPAVHVHIPNISVEPVEVNIPPIDVNIPPIDINIPRIDIDHHFRHHDWDDDHKHKSNKEDKEKTKGLKKIN